MVIQPPLRRAAPLRRAVSCQSDRIRVTMIRVTIRVTYDNRQWPDARPGPTSPGSLRTRRETLRGPWVQPGGGRTRLGGCCSRGGQWPRVRWRRSCARRCAREEEAAAWAGGPGGVLLPLLLLLLLLLPLPRAEGRRRRSLSPVGARGQAIPVCWREPSPSPTRGWNCRDSDGPGVLTRCVGGAAHRLSGAHRGQARPVGGRRRHLSTDFF